MRISTQMMYDQNMRGITDSQSKWLSYGEQMSTGKRVNRPSDDPIAASQAIVLSQSQSQNSQFALARTLLRKKSRSRIMYWLRLTPPYRACVRN